MPVDVVLIEDEISLREMVRTLLEGANFSVLALEHPRLIETLDPSDPPGVVLTDLSMPSMSGVDVAQWLREKGFADTPIIGMSASRLMLKMAEASNLFATTFLKPFETYQLLAALQEHAGRIRAWS